MTMWNLKVYRGRAASSFLPAPQRWQGWELRRRMCLPAAFWTEKWMHFGEARCVVMPCYDCFSNVLIEVSGKPLRCLGTSGRGKSQCTAEERAGRSSAWSRLDSVEESHRSSPKKRAKTAVNLMKIFHFEQMTDSAEKFSVRSMIHSLSESSKGEWHANI